MEQNNFEKNMQQKLGGLKIDPSESVWQNVEKRIEKKPQRKWLIFIIFFLLLFSFTGGYWLLNLEKSNHFQNQRNSSQDIGISATKKNSSSNQFLVPDKIDTNNVAFKKANTPVTSIVSVAKNENPHKRKSRKTFFLKKGSFKTGIQNVTASENEIKKEPTEKARMLQNDLSHNKTDLAIHNEGEVNTVVQQSKSDQNGRDSSIQLATIINQPAKKDTDLVVGSKKPPVTSHKNKWNFGITVSGGMSLIGNEFLGIDNNNYSDYLSSPGTGSNSGPGTPLSHSPSAIKNSFAFITGVFAEKNISAKHKISIGMNYKYFSTLNTVGNKIDSTQTAYNSSTIANAANNHRNNFNYLELPVLLKFRLGNSTSLPLYWQGGINISQLIGSNALQFQSAPGLYYNDNSFFNKTQLGFSTAISATIFSKQKTPVTVGPYFYYSSSRLSDKGLYGKKHFSFAGIRTEILFQKK